MGCVAVIRSAHELPDGRSNILTEGERRFVLRGWCASDRLYQRARVEEFDDDPVDPVEAGGLAAAVRAGFERLTAALNTLTRRGFGGPAAPPTPPTAPSFPVAGALRLQP